MVKAGVRKDRNRDEYWKRNQHQLPVSVIEQFNKATPTQRRTLVNKVVTQDPNGSWYINVNSAILKEWQGKYVDVRKDRGLVSKPPGLASTLWGGWGGLEDAKKRGEVWLVETNGKEYYQWREFTETEREGHRGGLVSEGTRKLDVEEYKRLNGALEQYNWNLQLTPKELKNWQEDEAAEVPKKVIDNLGKVQKACDKAYRDAREHYRQLTERTQHDVLAGPMAKKLKDDFEATPTYYLFLVWGCIPHWGPTSRRGPCSRLESRTKAWDPAWNSRRSARSRVLH